jgi:hypothetical protein
MDRPVKTAARLEFLALLIVVPSWLDVEPQMHY